MLVYAEIPKRRQYPGISALLVFKGTVARAWDGLKEVPYGQTGLTLERSRWNVLIFFFGRSAELSWKGSSRKIRFAWKWYSRKGREKDTRCWISKFLWNIILLPVFYLTGLWSSCATQDKMLTSSPFLRNRASLDNPDQDAGYPEGPIQVGLVHYNKNLRINPRNNARSGHGALDGFMQTVGDMRFSSLCRRMCSKALDMQQPGPPCYLTCRKDWIPVPNLESFLMPDCSKWIYPQKHLRRSVSSWTHRFGQTSSKGQGKECLESTSASCGRQENTLHLILDVENIGAIVCAIHFKINKSGTVHVENKQCNVSLLRVRWHTFTIMYNINKNTQKAVLSPSSRNNKNYVNGKG